MRPKCQSCDKSGQLVVLGKERTQGSRQREGRKRHTHTAMCCKDAAAWLVEPCMKGAGVPAGKKKLPPTTQTHDDDDTQAPVG